MLAGADPVRARARRAAPDRAPRSGCAAPGSLVAFALLAAFTAFSITWSLTPAESWLETNRTFAYLAALAGGLALGRLAPRRWSVADLRASRCRRS